MKDAKKVKRASNLTKARFDEIKKDMQGRRKHPIAWFADRYGLSNKTMSKIINMTWSEYCAFKAEFKAKYGRDSKKQTMGLFEPNHEAPKPVEHKEPESKPAAPNRVAAAVANDVINRRIDEIKHTAQPMFIVTMPAGYKTKVTTINETTKMIEAVPDRKRGWLQIASFVIILLAFGLLLAGYNQL